MEVNHDVCLFCEIVMVSANAAWEQSSCGVTAADTTAELGCDFAIAGVL